MAAGMLPAQATGRVQLLLQLNRPLDAEQEVGRLLALDPADPAALGLLGLCLLRQRRFTEAIAALYKALAAAPNEALTFAWLAEAQLEARNWEGAQASIGQALRLAPWEASFHGLLGVVHFTQHRPEQALQAARNGLALDPSDLQCQNIQARALAALGRPESGILSLGMALAEAPDNGIVHTNLGLNYLDAGSYEAAKTHFLAALRQRPGDPIARQGLLRAYKSRYWLYRALHLLQRSLLNVIRLSGWLKLERDTQQLLSYLLNILLVGGMWFTAFYYGFFSNISFAGVLLRMLLLSPLGVMLILMALGLVLRQAFLTLLRLNAAARPYLSAGEVLSSNCFIAASLITLLGIGLYTQPWSW